MTEGPGNTLRGLWPSIAASTLILLFGLGVEHFDTFSRFRHYVGNEAIPKTLARLGRSGKALRLLDYKIGANTRLEGFESSILPEEMPSTTILAPELIGGGAPVLSLVVDSKDLYDRDIGIVANPTKKGRSWERPAYATFFEDGRIRLATGVGVRVHGGKSRLSDPKSFQVYFRKLYGQADAPLELVGGESGDRINSLVVHSSLSGFGRKFHFVNPIAYEVAKRIGCIVPLWKPIHFYLNGEYVGPYVLTERINKDFMANHFGHTNFAMFDARSSSLKRGSRRDIAELLSWSDADAVPANMSEMNRKVDLANLTNWYISVLYAGTTDAMQGIAARDKTREGSRWFWINWDMDHSFVDIYSRAAHPWEIDTFGNINSDDARSVIFKKLMTTSPDYRSYFLTRLAEVLNHDLDQKFIDGLLQRYRATAALMHFERTYLLDNFGDFAKHRPAVLRQLVTQYLAAGPSHSLTVSAPASVPLVIDGRRVGQEYVGWYFAGAPATLELGEGADAEKFRWVIDGKTVEPAGEALSLDLSSDMLVRLEPVSWP